MKSLKTLLWLALILANNSSLAAETVDISAPISVLFYVTNVAANSTGSPNPSSISFTSASLDPNQSLRISVQAEAASFTPPSGSSIPASKVSWTTSNASGGSGSSGTLSSTVYTQIFQSNENPSSGGVDITWTLAAPGAGIRAGNHSITIRWKLESI